MQVVQACVRTARLQAARVGQHPRGARDPQRRLHARCAVGLDRRQPGGADRAAIRPAAQPGPADRRGGRCDRDRGVEGPGLGCPGVVRDDHRRARRGEICGLRWSWLDLDRGVVSFRASIGQLAGEKWEKGTKTHQHRRVTLDAEFVDVLREHRAHCDERAAALDTRVRPDGFVFSPAPDCSTQTNPDTVTQRYGRLAARLGIETHLHSLRHYSATELIAAGVDIRTVAGRLGHSGGGSTTLRTYTAFVLEADQRAAPALAARRPRPSAPP